MTVSPLSRRRTCLKSAPDRRESRSRGVVQSPFLMGGGEDGSLIVALLSSALSGSICSLTGDVNSSLNASRAHAVDIWRKANRASPWRTSAAHRPQSLDNLQHSSADDVIMPTRFYASQYEASNIPRKKPRPTSPGAFSYQVEAEPMSKAPPSSYPNHSLAAMSRPLFRRSVAEQPRSPHQIRAGSNPSGDIEFAI